MLIKDLRLKKDDIRFCQERRTKEKLRVFHKEENLRPLYTALPSHNEFFGDKAKFFVPGNL